MAGTKTPPAEEPKEEQTPAAIQITADEIRKLLGQKTAEAAKDGPKLDETVPGGRYKVNGVWVDANGKRLADQGEG